MYAFVVSFVRMYLLHCPTLAPHFSAAVTSFLFSSFSLFPPPFPSARVSVLESWTNKNPRATPTILIAVLALTNGGAAVAAASGREHAPSHGWRSVAAREYRPESGSARSRSVFGESWAICLYYSQSKIFFTEWGYDCRVSIMGQDFCSKSFGKALR